MYKSLTRSVFEPLVQSVPKMVSGPTKKKIVAAKKIIKKTKTPIENIPMRQVPLLPSFLEDDFNEPVNPATPNRRNTIDDMYKPIREALTAP